MNILKCACLIGAVIALAACSQNKHDNEANAEPTTVKVISPPDRPVITQLYYYDLTTGELFAGPIGKLPPIQAPSDPPDGKRSGVRAVVFSCDGCQNELRIGYLERKSEEAIRYWEKVTSGGYHEDQVLHAPDFLKSTEVRTLEHNEWFSMYSEQGSTIVYNAYQTLCPDGSKARECFPR